ncbi:TolB-like 6-bladed beta-propeller domain-containing protein [Algoriphagus limi]|uniref:TolB-like 6-bladed beta-propeller domain-containing protein n=1 Tax=Algoriphagus limi TaxID=2975273 RepID=A0ABT2G5A5_9BACT|nr:TolB-like 6-bladed beta-propeller domain-containing protein [Algoriphagus limi]MCS5490456.1 TolB-like 6-bladed beta-propeller domain-containing protein [Algoriphagus limi]
MKIKSAFKLLGILKILVFTACVQNSDEKDFVQAVPQNSNFLTFDSVHVVNEFPKIHAIEKGVGLRKEFIGMKDFEIIDSLMVVSTSFQKFWSIYQLPSLDSLGSFLSLGEGPKEFSYPSIASDKVLFRSEGDDITALIYQFSKGNLLKFNLNQSIKLGQDSLELADNDLPLFLFDLLILESDHYYIRQPENQETKQNRYLLSQGQLSSNKLLDQLNRAEVSNGMLNLSLMASMTRLSPERDKILEMYFRLNYFNLYALDGSLKKTIAIEPTLDDLSLLEKVPQPERNYRFSDVRAYDDFFALLHLNELEQDFATDRKSFPEILIFDWEGNPISKLVFEDFFTSFDFDLVRQKVYTFDSQTDQFKVHDLPFDFN